VHPTPVALCAIQWYSMRCSSITRMGATSVGPLTPTLVWGCRLGDCNESPTPQRDLKVTGKVRLTTEVLIRRNLEYPHTSAPPRNRSRNRSAICPTPCRLDYTVMGSDEFTTVALLCRILWTVELHRPWTLPPKVQVARC